MTKYLIEVTAADIAESQRLKRESVCIICITCPIALAVSRALGEQVMVNGAGWVSQYYKPQNGVLIPAVARLKLGHYDWCNEMEPFTFELEWPYAKA